MLNLLLNDMERNMNALENEKQKLLLPNIFPFIIVEEEHDRLRDLVSNLKSKLEKIIEIEIQKDLMYRQLTEYIPLLEKETQNPYSKSQGFIGKHHFYVKPLIDIKTILFNDLRGMFGVSLYTTIDINDQVLDQEQFKNFILLKRKQIDEANNMFQLFEICKNFVEEIKTDFC